MSQNLKATNFGKTQLSATGTAGQSVPVFGSVSNSNKPFAMSDSCAYAGGRPLSAEIADWLGEEIISGRLLPGTRLVARDLSERLGVSITPVREAFCLMSGEGLVELSSRRGASVAEITPEEVEDIYECRAALHELAARQCATRASEEELEILNQIANAMVEAYRAGDNEECFRLNLKFHDQLLSSTRNETLEKITVRLGRRTLQLKRISLGLPGRLEKSVKMHLSIADALRHRKGNFAGAMMREQIADAAAALVKFAQEANRSHDV